MRRTIAFFAAAAIAAGIVRIATADDQGSTLITVQWDGGAGDASAPTPTVTPLATTPPPVIDAGAAPVATTDASAPASDGDAGPSKFRGSIDEYYKYTGIDLDVSGGGGYFWGQNGFGAGVGFGRVRAGIMAVRWPFMYAVGATYEINNLSPAAWGVQAEILHIGAGIWAQLGGSVDYKGEFGGMASVGWSMLGIEAQVRGYKDVLPFAQPNDPGYGFALVGKVRIPVGFILYVLTRK